MPRFQLTRPAFAAPGFEERLSVGRREAFLGRFTFEPRDLREPVSLPAVGAREEV